MKAEDLAKQVAMAAAPLEDDTLASQSPVEIQRASEETLRAEEKASWALREARTALALRESKQSERFEDVDRVG